MREYGEARPVSGSVRIISTMKVEARHDMNALMHLMICAAFRLELMVYSTIRVIKMMYPESMVSRIAMFYVVVMTDDR